MNLLTRMKSPTSSVGRIDDDGILKGSARKLRSRKTTSRTGKNDFEYSTHTGSAASGARREAKKSRSSSQTTPVTAVRTKRIRAKFIEREWKGMGSRGQEGRAGGARHCRTGQIGARDVFPSPLARTLAMVAEIGTRGAIPGANAGDRDSRSGNASLAPISKYISGTDLLVADRQDREEGLLRNLDATDGLHPLLARLLLLEQLLLARDVAAVALGEHVLAQRLDVLARDHLRPDRRLHGNVEHLSRNQRSHPRGDLAAAVNRVRPMDHHRQRIDALAVDQDVELYDVGRAKLLEFVIERRVAARDRFQPVEKVHHHFGHRQLVGEQHLSTHVLHVLLHAAPLGAKREHGPDIILRHQNRRGDDRL